MADPVARMPFAVALGVSGANNFLSALRHSVRPPTICIEFRYDDMLHWYFPIEGSGEHIWGD
ncbi:hypothetical protein [Phaeobacter sp. J2-8]|uniref:hypothetical protein n=1 Tax=Phaeobacter sp. J2-8 TaxID=2931394 RepID=UPI001FD30993|nr:hypothetical protein [Phaeobacter sp. J2-8]MCJ7871009.1 hypothetical protein [Phaeobacter sp. J2-8]